MQHSDITRKDNAVAAAAFSKETCIYFGFLLCVFFTMAPSLAFACDGAMQYSICFIVSSLSGDLGTAIAMLGISAVSGAAILGKASWGMALTVTAGISMLFGAGALADLLGIGNGCDNSCWPS